MVSPRRRQPLRYVMVLSSLLGAAAGGGALVLVLMSARPPTVRVDVEAPDVHVDVPASDESCGECADDESDDSADDEVAVEPERPVEHPVLRGCVDDPELVGIPEAAGIAAHAVQPLVGAVASGCVIAAWGYSELYVSRDDGSTFAEVMQHDASVGDVAITADGTVYALRDEGTLSLARPDGTELFRELPVEMQRLVAGGAWLAGIAGGTVAVSRDGGQTWRFHTLPATDVPDPDSSDVSIEPDGTLRVVSTFHEVEAESGTILRLAAPGGAFREVARWAESRRNVILPDGGVASQLSDSAWELHTGHSVRVLAGVDDVVTANSTALLLDATALWRLSGGRRHRLTDAALGDLATVDRTGNPIVLPNGEGDLAHWSPRGGLRTLLASTSQAE